MTVTLCFVGRYATVNVCAPFKVSHSEAGAEMTNMG
jgi:hypothetical protein